MSQTCSASLPAYDRKLLRAVGILVRFAERGEWLAPRQAELWHLRHRGAGRRRQTLAVIADASLGVTCDAPWLRTESWRRTLQGTAVLCLAALSGFIGFAAASALAPHDGWRALSPHLLEQFSRFLCAAPLVLFVAFATSSRGPMEQEQPGRRRFWIKRQAFLAAKVSLALVLSFLLSVDISEPLRLTLPHSGDLLQVFCFVLGALLGVQWALRDQEQRCKQCLRSLASPARVVAALTHSLLEWSGTELICKHAHGPLSVPEMETRLVPIQSLGSVKEWLRSAGDYLSQPVR